MGKLYFAQAKFSQVLHEFDGINLDSLTLHAVNNRMLKILAEGLAVKGLSFFWLIGVKFFSW